MKQKEVSNSIKHLHNNIYIEPLERVSSSRLYGVRNFGGDSANKIISKYILSFKRKVLYLHSVEPAKPLNNAQIGGSFFYIYL